MNAILNRVPKRENTIYSEVILTIHFGDVPQANLLPWYGKTKPNTAKERIHQSKQSTTNKINTQKTKPGLVTSYDIQPRKGEGLFLFQRIINLSLTCLLKHLPTFLQPHTHMWQMYILYTFHQITKYL